MNSSSQNLDMIKAELLEKKEILTNNLASLEDFKKTPKAQRFNYLKKVVALLNSNSIINCLGAFEQIYFLDIVIFSLSQPEEKEEIVQSFKQLLERIQNITIWIESKKEEIKHHPSKINKKRALKINESSLRTIGILKQRYSRIKADFDQFGLNPPIYMENILKSPFDFYEKLKKYEDNPDLMLYILYYYYFPENCEWEDEDREFVLKNYS